MYVYSIIIHVVNKQYVGGFDVETFMTILDMLSNERQELLTIQKNNLKEIEKLPKGTVQERSGNFYLTYYCDNEKTTKNIKLGKDPVTIDNAKKKVETRKQLSKELADVEEKLASVEKILKLVNKTLRRHVKSTRGKIRKTEADENLQSQSLIANVSSNQETEPISPIKNHMRKIGR